MVTRRRNRHFPAGEITGEMWIQSIDELVSEPVTRVIIRDPESSAEDFVELADRVGLHGTNYFVGYTAWLDIAPEGVSKASALAEVAAVLGNRTRERSGVLVVVPIPEQAALDAAELDAVIDGALAACDADGITGAAVTPFVLARIGAATEGRSVPANLALAEHNASVAAEIAVAITV